MVKKTIKKTTTKAVVKNTSVKKAPSKKASTKKVESSRYYEGKGGRKTSIARVRISSKVKGITVNDKAYKEYFKEVRLQKDVEAPFEVMGLTEQMGATVKVKGGGLKGQAGAVRHGLARALVLFNEEFRKRLRKEGFLTRDPRMVERKKYGLRKARRAPQWAKR